ncbi:hypothetical protein AB1E19_010317 [Capra hircus]
MERSGKRRASQALRGARQGTQQEQRERGGAHELSKAHAATPGESGRPAVGGLSQCGATRGGAGGVGCYVQFQLGPVLDSCQQVKEPPVPSGHQLLLWQAAGNPSCQETWERRGQFQDCSSPEVHGFVFI